MSMIKKLQLAAGLFASVTAFAQTPIIITSLDMPNANDSIHVSVVGSSDLISVPAPAPTGTGYVWDYSMLTPNVQQFEKYDDPQNFTTPYNYLFNPFNTSYGRDDYEYSAIPLPGAQISAAYDFYKESFTEQKQIGAGYIINSIPIPFLYTSDDIIYKFPMSYTNMDSCDYKYGLDIPSIGYYGQSGHRVNEVDGWGSLVTPFGTFQTLRVKSTITAVDTVYNTSLSTGANIPRPTKYEYKWLANGKKIPVLKVEVTKIAGNETVTNVRYIDSVRSGVPQVGIVENAGFDLNSTVYPNPCTDQFTLQYELPINTAVKVEMVDVLGKIISTVVNEKQAAGVYKKAINVSDLHLSKGIYYLQIQTGQFKEIKKIVIR